MTLNQVIVEGIELSPERAKFGLTKMFFKAGVIGDLEDARDEKIASILTTLQAEDSRTARSLDGNSVRGWSANCRLDRISDTWTPVLDFHEISFGAGKI